MSLGVPDLFGLIRNTEGKEREIARADAVRIQEQINRLRIENAALKAQLDEPCPFCHKVRP